MSLSVKIPRGFNSIKMHPWVLPVTLHLPPAGISEVTSCSGTSEENTDIDRKSLQRAQIPASVRWALLRVTALCCRGALAHPHALPHPHSKAFRMESPQPQHRTGSRETASIKPGSLPASQMPENLPVPTANGTVGLWSPSRERRGWRKERHFITQQER